MRLVWIRVKNVLVFPCAFKAHVQKVLKLFVIDEWFLLLMAVFALSKATLSLLVLSYLKSCALFKVWKKCKFCFGIIPQKCGFGTLPLFLLVFSISRTLVSSPLVSRYLYSEKRPSYMIWYCDSSVTIIFRSPVTCTSEDPGLWKTASKSKQELSPYDEQRPTDMTFTSSQIRIARNLMHQDTNAQIQAFGSEIYSFSSRSFTWDISLHTSYIPPFCT
jgi:hypothetical protein